MKASIKRAKSGERVQVAALPMRIDVDGNPQVLLLTSRETKRWIIPKGWIMKGRKRWEAAAQEALEEAGIVGRLRKTPVGNYVYIKRRAAHSDVCRVEVYLLSFTKQLETWREKGQRQAKWFGFGEAAALVDEPGLIKLLLDLHATGIDERKSQKPVQSGLELGRKVLASRREVSLR
jgi:8-oxo-dGTP pyrophosphatase MutT (NUDIX family)